MRADDGPSEADLALYEEMCERYESPIEVVSDIIHDAGLVVTTRFPKTAGTLIEKLRRDRTRLSTVQDVAGARVVIDGGRNSQDSVVKKLADRLNDVGRADIIDRREEPSHGYRAVHIIARVDGIPVEIQVRTVLQDTWANTMERFADIFGRQVRYGELPTDPDKQLSPEIDELTPRSLHQLILDLGTSIHRIESANQGYESFLESGADSLVFDSTDVDFGDLAEEDIQALVGQDVGDILKGFVENLQNLGEHLQLLLKKLEV